MKRNLAASAAALTAAAALSGCVVLESSPKPDGTEVAAPAPSQPEPEGSTEPGDGETSGPLPDLLDSGATYARAIQAFSPSIELWTIDGDRITYVERNCVGAKKVDARGTLGPEQGGIRVITWEGENPIAGDGGEFSGMETPFEIDDERLVEEGMPEMYAATPDVEEQEREFIGMCAEVGEMVAGVG